MASSLARTGAVLSTASRLSSVFTTGSRNIHATAACCKNRAARLKITNDNRGLTYEQSLPPHHIAHRKGWLSQHTSNLKGEEGAAERATEDLFIRRFMYGTFLSTLADEVVIKRRGNAIIVCMLLLQLHAPHKIYFLIGYSEYLLSHFYKCPVKLEVQTLTRKVLFREMNAR